MSADLCEWWPEQDKPAEVYTERFTVGGKVVAKITHYGCQNQAVFLIGADGEWRLCASCAALPKFKNYRCRRPVRQP